jgi:hypothetical protein
VDGKALPTTADWVEPSAYVGSYHIEAMGMSLEVTSKQDGLWVHLAGDEHRLYPHEPHVFHTFTARVEFVVEEGVATGFSVQLEDGPTAQGVRVE